MTTVEAIWSKGIQTILRIPSRLASYFGAHAVPQREEHERERAFQRGWATVAILIAWLVVYSREGTVGPTRVWLILFCLTYGISTFLYRAYLKRNPNGGTGIQYTFLVVDPLALVLILVEDPRTFAFLNPFLLVVIVRCGIRYGIRTMWLVWSVSIVAAATLLPKSTYWRTETELTLTFVLILAFVPVFFPSLIRRVHNIRAIEEERARLDAMDQVITARSAFLSKVSHELRSPFKASSRPSTSSRCGTATAWRRTTS